MFGYLICGIRHENELIDTGTEITVIFITKPLGMHFAQEPYLKGFPTSPSVVLWHS